MAYYQNLHTHTTYCDGRLDAESMVLAAIKKGGSSIGFSEHSYVSFDEDYSMPLDDIPIYIQDVLELKKKYEDTIEVFLGMEVDYFTTTPPIGLDYIIGASHHVQNLGVNITVDGCANHLEQINIEHFGGDYLMLAELYYSTITDVVEKTNADIVGHFDLVAKHNINGRMFDEMHPRYTKAALAAMDKVLNKCKLFEVNTGAMYRLGKVEPYPSTFLLTELYKRGGEVILSSDSHNADSLYFKFDEMLNLVKSCGFKHIKRLTKDGFIDVPL